MFEKYEVSHNNCDVSSLESSEAAVHELCDRLGTGQVLAITQALLVAEIEAAQDESQKKYFSEMLRVSEENRMLSDQVVMLNQKLNELTARL